jgi:beta-lactamase regulating signal transducer with metallopeptidase domain
MVPAADAIARIAAERMLNSVIAGLVLTILAWALLRLVPRTNAGTRVAVWFSVLVAVPGLLLAALFLASSSTTAQSKSTLLVVPAGWAFAGFVAWAAIAGAALLRVVSGLWRIRRMRRTCNSIDLATLDSTVAQTVAQFRPNRPVSLLRSATARVPMAVGFFKPAVILPEWALNELSPAELAAVLLHEFAHLRRWDDWSNFFQKILRALFFFHPAMWWLDRRLALDREIACDDIVLAATNNAHAYASCLVDVAEKSLLRRSLALAQAAVHRVQHMSLRISQIMDSTRPRATRVSRIALAAVAALAGACLVGVLHTPTLIALDEGASQVESSRSIAGLTPVLTRDLGAAHVLPAMLRQKPPGRPDLQKPSLIARKRKPQQPAAVVATAVTARTKQQPNLLRAGMSAQTPVMMPVGSMLLVMRDGSIDPSGRVIWTLSVWHVTVFHPVQSPIQGTTAANSI